MEYMDFFDAEPANNTLTGKFGIPDSNGKLINDFPISCTIESA
jgi:hypothetical protein